MSLASDMAAVALDMLNAYGHTVTYNRIVNGSYNTATSTFSQTQTNFTAKGLVEEAADRGKDPSLVAVTNRKLTMAASAFSNTPTLVDTVQIGTSTFIINDINTIYVADTAVLYVFDLQKG